MSFDIDVPTTIGDKDLCAFFRGWTWLDDPPTPVVLNVTRGTHMAPWAATLFGAYAIWLKEVRGKDVTLEYDGSTYVGRFLERIGLPQLLGVTSITAPDPDMRVFPITRITESKQIAPTVNSLVAMLTIGDPEVEDAVRYSLVELLRNVVQHARSRIGGFVSAVYFPKSELVDVVVADIGCGVRATLREAYPEINSTRRPCDLQCSHTYPAHFRVGNTSR